jgi:micrococcal nuclease
MTPETNLYFYKTKFVGAYDGDTITVDIDMGLGVWVKKQKLRVYGIDTPELRGDEKTAGLAARDALLDLLRDRELVIETIKDATEKYGRWLARIWIKQDDGTWLNAGDELVKTGHARVYLGD